MHTHTHNHKHALQIYICPVGMSGFIFLLSLVYFSYLKGYPAKASHKQKPEQIDTGSVVMLVSLLISGSLIFPPTVLGIFAMRIFCKINPPSLVKWFNIFGHRKNRGFVLFWFGSPFSLVQGGGFCF